MRQVEIPGGHATLRDQRTELKMRQQRVLDNAMVAALPALEKVQDRKAWEGDGLNIRSANLTRQDADVLMERQDATIIALLASWTLDEPLPTMDTLGDLDTDLYDALRDAVREVTNTTDVLQRSDFKAAPGENPTGNSRDSSVSVRENEASDSNGTPLSDGESSATARSSKSRTRSS